MDMLLLDRMKMSMKTTKAVFGILSISLALAGQVQAQFLLTNSIVAYFPLTGNAIDASGNGNNLTNYGPTLCADRFGNPNQAFHFKGLNRCVPSAPTNSGLSFAPANITFSSWLKADPREVKLAAANGNRDAQVKLAELYYTGKAGLSTNVPEAYRWAFIASTSGDKHAKYLVGEIELFISPEDKSAGKALVDSYLAERKQKATR